MLRDCAHCHRPFQAKDLDREESKGMEAERKAHGLRGVLFRYYVCPECGYSDIFVDVRPLDGESQEAFQQRWSELETTIRQLHAEKVEVVLA